MRAKNLTFFFKVLLLAADGPHVAEVLGDVEFGVDVGCGCRCASDSGRGDGSCVCEYIRQSCGGLSSGFQSRHTDGGGHYLFV